MWLWILPAPPDPESPSGWFLCPRWFGSAGYSSAEERRSERRSLIGVMQTWWHVRQSDNMMTYFMQGGQVLVGFTDGFVFFGVLQIKWNDPYMRNWFRECTRLKSKDSGSRFCSTVLQRNSRVNPCAFGRCWFWHRAEMNMNPVSWEDSHQSCF